MAITTFPMDLRNQLVKALEWENDFQHGMRDFEFDIDDELFVIAQKHGVDLTIQPFHLIYALADYYVDAVKHGFKNIDKNYSLKEARADIILIIEKLEQNTFGECELDRELTRKLQKLFFD